jgi:hypothetical protein
VETKLSLRFDASGITVAWIEFGSMSLGEDYGPPILEGGQSGLLPSAVLHRSAQVTSLLQTSPSKTSAD